MSRLAGVRLVVLMAVSFFVGLQFRSLRVLFRTSYYDGPRMDHLAWAPADMHISNSNRSSKRRMQNAKLHKLNDIVDTESKDETSAEEEPEEDEKEEESNEEPIHAEPLQKLDADDQNEEEELNEKPKKARPVARFNAMNYTKDFAPLQWSLPKPSRLLHLSSAEFMEKYIAAKRKMNVTLPWEHSQDVYDNTKLPLPIISLNFPKSATLTMRQYFNCGGVTSIHTSTQHGRIGICMMENMLADNPPLQHCDTHKRQGKTKKIGFISDIGLQGPPCFYSSIHDGGLEAIAKHYPSSTILLVTRNSTSWYHSIKKWGVLLHRWKTVCKFDGSHHGEQVQYWSDMHESESKADYWSNFYNAHTQKIREFALKHLSLTYVEVQLEDPKMGELLEYYTGIPSTCVMDCHPGPHWYKKTNATSKCHPPGDPWAEDAPKAAVNVHVDDDGGGSENDDNDENGYDEE
ncbi:hypothetical protein HJC23_001646 [Cyclotella cryptica]|uniref:Sulfotransferase n=1 Tax=Cyclotella cryptica TaxID=29204 RepID=A0ABD3QKV2_9STRA|eukprot:CCRYP_004663-RA/>CCRYP_004663-RA protein AED:0.00 eAED:0.00 QI:222/-1/1/1/-1/1/1/975/459